jgi:hypothetical protein
MDVLSVINRRSPLPLLIYCVAVLVIAYWLGLGGLHIPKLGDELIYAHIAFKTALTQQWLPFASDLGAMRNTKPPLLFWQAMVGPFMGLVFTAAAQRALHLWYRRSGRWPGVPAGSRTKAGSGPQYRLAGSHCLSVLFNQLSLRPTLPNRCT